jgi:hypothetical protein
MKSLQEQFLNQPAPSAVNTNTKVTKVMGKNIVKAELVVNITLSATNILSTSTLDTAQAKKGVIIKTRSVGSVNYNTNDNSVYASFIPLTEKFEDAYGKYNCAVWKITDDQGVERLLSHEESINYWNIIINEEGVDAAALDFFVKVNFPASDTFKSVDQGLRDGVIRSYSIVFNDLNNMFEFRTDAYRNNLCLIPANATVQFNRAVVELVQETLGAGTVALDSILSKTAARRKSFKEFLKAPTKSSARREDRKAAVATPKVADTIVFDGAPIATRTTPVVEVVTAVVASTPALVVEEVVNVVEPEVIPTSIVVEEVATVAESQVQVQAARAGASVQMSRAEMIARRNAARGGAISFDSTSTSKAPKQKEVEMDQDEIDAILDAMSNYEETSFMTNEH